jgi:hypothetical protein
MRHVIITAVIAAALMLSQPALAGFVKGPYIQKVSKTGVVFVWQTESASPGTVAWGLDESLGNSLEVAAGTMHEAGLDGLKANTTYFYQVTSDGQTSNLYHFKTAPSAYSPFRFVAFGDSRSGYNEHRRVASSIMAEDPSLYINSGDLVCNGPDEMCWQEHFDIELELMATRFLLPALGNHDTEGLNCVQYKRYFSLPANGVEAHDELYYHVDWGNTRFIVLDDQIASYAAGSLQYEWLLYTLQEAADDPYIQHIFLVTHMGPYSAKPERAGNTHMRNLIETLAEYKVTAIFSGHDHHYYRGQAHNGVDFIVTGGGGASLYDCQPKADFGVRNIQCVKDYNYVVLDVNGPYVTATAKTADGQVIEEWDWVSEKKLPDMPADGDEPNPDGDAPDGDTQDGDTPDGDTPQVDGDEPQVDGDEPFRPGDGSGAQEYNPEFGFSGCSQHADGEAFPVFVLLALGLLFVGRRRGAHLFSQKG